MILGIFDKLFKRKHEQPGDEEYSQIEMQTYAGEMDTIPDSHVPELYNAPTELEMESKIFYKFKGMDYKLKLRNKSIDMLGDITVFLHSQKSAIAKIIDSKRTVEMLEPEKSIVLKFRIQPNYKLGKSGIYGKIEYFDFKSKERKLLRLPQNYVEFQVKKIDSQRIDEDKWRQICGGLESYDIETEMLEIPPHKVFETFKRVINSLGLNMLPPIENVNLYRGIARFYGRDADKTLYTPEVQVIGDKKNSKVLFRIWSNEPQNAMALAFKTIDIVERDIEIKKFIVET